MKLVQALLVAVITCSACATAGESAAQTAPPGQDASATELTPPKPEPGQMSEESSYVIGPGDIIQVFVWRESELSISVPVRSDGKVTTPLVEDIVAVGLTPSELARAMEVRLAEYIRSPQVNIIVTSAQSAFNKITVIGRVKTPKAIPYRQGMTLLDVVLEVGGLDDFAAGNRSRILRKNADGKEQEIRVKVADLVKKGRSRENIPMQPGDTLIVPESLL